MRTLTILMTAMLLLIASACGGDGDDPPSAASPDAPAETAAVPEEGVSEETAEGDFPDVVGAEAEMTDDGVWRVSATISSPYDSPERYADAWRVLGPDGEVLGVRELAHDHASEQPFTRSLSDVEIPSDIPTVTIEGRDLANSWGGGTFELDLPS